VEKPYERRVRPGGRRVAFVLSGGAIQVGVLRALVGHGIRPDVIVGTSVGALNGAFLAARDFDAETVDEVNTLWLEVRRGAVFPVAPLSALLGSAPARSSSPFGPSGSWSCAMSTASGSKTSPLRCTSSPATRAPERRSG
jgi:Patatin-like phospholipase